MLNIIDCVRQTYPYVRGADLLCPPEPIEHLASPLLPRTLRANLEIEAEAGTLDNIGGPDISWKLINPDVGVAESLSVSEGSTKNIPRYKYRHDIVAGGLRVPGVNKTDRRMDTICTCGDDSDGWTPDFIIAGDRYWLVIEITTRRTNEERSLLNAFREKRFKYESALRDRVENVHKTIIFILIVVSPERVFSSIELSRDVVDDLIMRMRLTIDIESIYFEKFGIEMGSDERYLYDDMSMKAIFEGISKIGIDKGILPTPEIDEAFINKVFPKDTSKLVTKTFFDAFTKCSSVTSSFSKNEAESQLKDYIDSFDCGERRSDKKPVVIFPMIIPARSEVESSDIEVRTLIDDEDRPHIKLWYEAFRQHMNHQDEWLENPNELLNEATIMDEEELRILQQSRKEKRKTYHRVNFGNIIDHEERVALALNGLWRKSLKKEHAIQADRERSQKGFTWDTSTADIDDFMTNTAWLDSIGITESLSIALLERANDATGNTDEGMNCLKEWCGTKIFRWLDFISDLMMEVGIANKQNCQPRGMILKKLRKYEAFMLIHPTNSAQHCFVSLFIPRHRDVVEMGVLPGLKYHKNYCGYFTDFVSFKPGKIENKVGMPASLISLASYWSWFYQLEDAKPSTFSLPGSTEAFQMLMLSLLIRLEDKESTELAITQTRYMFMEVFKSDISFYKPNPLKVLPKLTNYPRSRLTLFVVKGIALSFFEMTLKPPSLIKTKNTSITEEEELPPNDTWTGIVNPYTKGSLGSTMRAINLAYLGYLKNKNEDAEGNVEFLLIEKIVEEEIGMAELTKEEIDGEAGKTEPPRSKTFSLDHVLHGCGVMARRLEALHGPRWKEVISKDVLKMLSTRMTEEIATLKASCNIAHEKANFMIATVSTNYSAGRIRVMQALLENIKQMDLNPMWNLESILTFIEQHTGGIIVDIFKKPQHGGVREIFVLTIQSRVIQLYLETVSRVICSYFDEETMTHPQNKIAKIDNHRISAEARAQKRECLHVNLCSSSDKTRWSQSMMMTELYAVVSYFLPDEYKGSIQRCLNLWCRKKIKVPQRILNLLFSDTNIENEVYRLLKFEYDLEEPTRFFTKRCDPFLSIKSGMMQGILHYTSSLLHVAFLNSMQSIIPAMIVKLYPGIYVDMTQVCSSDDSATIITVYGPEQSRESSEMFSVAILTAEIALDALSTQCKYYGMKESIKSTTPLVNMVEYNSCFFMKNTITIPVIKFLSASLLLAETESMLKRQQILYNSLGELYSSGFPGYNTHLAQLAQGLLHYKTMGSSVNPLFREYYDRIMVLPDPVYGFFLLDAMWFPGVMGLGFSHWLLSRIAPIFRFSLKALDSNNLEVTAEGGILRTLTMKMGDNARWKALVKSTKGDLDLEEEVEKMPSLLFRRALDKDELKIKIALKATMPSVATSMMKGNSFLQAVASSVYSINTHCYTKVSVVKDLMDPEEKRSKFIGKTCLLRELDERIASIDMTTVQEETNERGYMMFPFIERYREAEYVIDEIKNYRLIKSHLLRNKRTTIQIQPTKVELPISFKQVACNLWFNMGVPYSPQSIERCRKIYVEEFPWFKDTIQETLRCSPFETYQELAGFLEAYALKTRKMVRIGPSAHSANFQMKLMLLARRSFKTRHLLIRKGMRGEILDVGEFQSKINLAICIPDENVRRRTCRDVVFDSIMLSDTDIGIKNLVGCDKKLAIIQVIEKEACTKQGLAAVLQDTGTGSIITYPKEQRRVKGEDGKVHWKGSGLILVKLLGAALLLKVNDDKCETIQVNKWSYLERNARAVNAVLKKLSLKNNDIKFQNSMIAVLTNNGYSRGGNVGTPIYSNTGLSTTHTTELNPVITYKFLKISLDQKDPDKNSRKQGSNILTYKHRPQDVIVKPSSSVYNDIWKAWMAQGKLDFRRALKWLVTLQSQKNDPRKGRGGQIDEKVRNWILDCLHARLVTKHAIDSTIRSSTWENALAMPSEEKYEEEMPEEEFESLRQLMMEELMSKEAAALRKKITSSLLEDGVDNFDLKWLSSALDAEAPLIDATSNIVGNFKRRVPLFDDLIDSVEKQTSDFWNKTFAGIIPGSNVDLAMVIMELFGIEIVQTIQDMSSYIAIMKKEITAESGEEDSEGEYQPLEMMEHPKHVAPTIVSKEEEPTADSDDEESDDDEDEDYEGFSGLTEEDLCGMADDIRSSVLDNIKKQEVVPPINMSNELESQINILQHLDTIEELSTKSKQKLNDLWSIVQDLSIYNVYRINSLCDEPTLMKARHSVVHDGNCWFYSIVTAMGNAFTVRELKNHLLRSRWLDYCTDPATARHILEGESLQADSDIIKVFSLEYKINVCIHKSREGVEDEAEEFIHFRISHECPTIHLLWYNFDRAFSAKYEPLVVVKVLSSIRYTHEEVELLEMENMIVPDDMIEIVEPKLKKTFTEIKTERSRIRSERKEMEKFVNIILSKEENIKFTDKIMEAKSIANNRICSYDRTLNQYEKVCEHLWSQVSTDEIRPPKYEFKFEDIIREQTKHLKEMKARNQNRRGGRSSRQSKLETINEDSIASHGGEHSTSGTSGLGTLSDRGASAMNSSLSRTSSTSSTKSGSSASTTYRQLPKNWRKPDEG